MSQSPNNRLASADAEAGRQEDTPNEEANTLSLHRFCQIASADVERASADVDAGCPGNAPTEGANALSLHRFCQLRQLEDNTDLIRTLRHSDILEREVLQLLDLQAQFGDDDPGFCSAAAAECTFLCMYYTDIYQRIRKRQLNVDLLLRCIGILRQIENGTYSHQQGQTEAESLFLQLFSDSAQRRSAAQGGTDPGTAAQGAAPAPSAHAPASAPEAEPPVDPGDQGRGPSVNLSWAAFRNRLACQRKALEEHEQAKHLAEALRAFDKAEARARPHAQKRRR